MPSRKIEEAGIFSFPGGKRLQKFTFSAREIKRTANPDYVIVKPLTNLKMGVFDLKKGILASGFDKNDGTLWNNLMAYESVSGKILLREVSYNETEKSSTPKTSAPSRSPSVRSEISRPPKFRTASTGCFCRRKLAAGCGISKRASGSFTCAVSKAAWSPMTA